MVDRALEAGINIFDTATVYSSGGRKSFWARRSAPDARLGARRKDVLIATKVYAP